LAGHEAAQHAVDRARRGDGPSLLEMKTYRYRGHSRTDPAKYRVPGELERWQERDPITLLAAVLELPEDEQQAIRGELQARVDAAAAGATEAPYLTLEEARAYVYAS
jgi:TPP-dependent pyruvate/acetoin dehydrogenase alpha subunit